MKVNMTPNPLDVVTIHASQGDTEARQWEFELHNNGELIDTSEITEQMFFKAYKGGTEQILPENTSTPTTSPFLGDIKYPQGLLTNQEFTYRQSPTEEDGLAKITDIKGNTLVWNQLVQNGNFVSKSAWIESVATYSVSNNVATVTASAQYGCIQAQTNYKAHKYLVCCDLKLTTASSYQQISLRPLPSVVITGANTTEWQHLARIFTATEGTFYYPRIIDTRTTGFDAFYVKNVMLFDLTQMGLDSIANPSEFTSLFSLPYYAYNQGTLLSFNGNGIKTVGFNQWDEEWESGRINSDGTKATSSTYIRSKNYIHIFPNTTYYRKSPNNIQPFYYDGNMNFISYGLWGANSTFVTPNNAEYMLFHIDPAYGTTYNNDICINISSSRNGEYEPYTSSTLSLPISTYFPTGMKSAYNSSSLTDIVRDELSQTKAIKKVKQITFDGSSDENWSIENINSGSASGQHNFYTNVAPAKKLSSVMNNMAVPYALYTQNYIDGKINSYVSNGQNLNFYPGTDITSVADFRTWLSNHPLTVNIALPTDSYEETSFTTASLVTENAEIPLSNNDGVLIGKCTEELSAEPGFHDAKIKLSDSDGTCYSNKIQLHIERSPQ